MLSAEFTRASSVRKFWMHVGSAFDEWGVLLQWWDMGQKNGVRCILTLRIQAGLSLQIPQSILAMGRKS